MFTVIMLNLNGNDSMAEWAQAYSTLSLWPFFRSKQILNAYNVPAVPHNTFLPLCNKYYWEFINLIRYEPIYKRPYKNQFRTRGNCSGYKIIVGCSNNIIYATNHRSQVVYYTENILLVYKCRETTAVTQLLLANYEILCHACDQHSSSSNAQNL